MRRNHLLDDLVADVSLKVIYSNAKVEDADCISDHRLAYTIIDTKTAPRPLVPFQYQCTSRIDPAKFELMLRLVWFNVRQHNNGYIHISFWEGNTSSGVENSQRNKTRLH
jgi:hypothetical protein